MPNATTDANTARNAMLATSSGVKTERAGGVSKHAPITQPSTPSVRNWNTVSTSTSCFRANFDTNTMCTANSRAPRSVMHSPKPMVNAAPVPVTDTSQIPTTASTAAMSSGTNTLPL